MQIEDVNGVKVERYDTGEVMTMKRWQRFNKFVMIDNEVGSDFIDFNSKMARGINFLKKGLVNDGVKALDNFRQLVFNAFTEYSPKGMALALTIHKIGDEVYNDITASGLQKVLDRLEDIGFTKGMAEAFINDVKKKS